MKPTELSYHTYQSISGVIDRYGSKAEVFIVPIANAVLILMFISFHKVITMANSSESPEKISKFLDAAIIAVDIVLLGLCIWYFVFIGSIAFTA